MLKIFNVSQPANRTFANPGINVDNINVDTLLA
jgi:hypothetical protein